MNDEKQLLGRPIPEAMGQVEAAACEARQLIANGMAGIAEARSALYGAANTGIDATIRIPQDWKISKFLPSEIKIHFELTKKEGV
jgi:hypothetical protein